MPDVHGEDAKGYWPACWALGATQRTQQWDWPASGEPDLAESVNGVNRNWSTLHCGYAAQWGGPCGEPVGLSNSGVAPETGDLWGQQHLYAFGVRGPFRIRRRDAVVPGLQTGPHTVRASSVPADVWALLSDHAGYRLILNVAMGGQFPAALGVAARREGSPPWSPHAGGLREDRLPAAPPRAQESFSHHQSLPHADDTHAHCQALYPPLPDAFRLRTCANSDHYRSAVGRSAANGGDRGRGLRHPTGCSQRGRCH